MFRFFALLFVLVLAVSPSEAVQDPTPCYQYLVGRLAAKRGVSQETANNACRDLLFHTAREGQAGVPAGVNPDVEPAVTARQGLRIAERSWTISLHRHGQQDTLLFSISGTVATNDNRFAQIINHVVRWPGNAPARFQVVHINYARPDATASRNLNTPVDFRKSPSKSTIGAWKAANWNKGQSFVSKLAVNPAAAGRCSEDKQIMFLLPQTGERQENAVAVAPLLPAFQNELEIPGTIAMFTVGTPCQYTTHLLFAYSARYERVRREKPKGNLITTLNPRNPKAKPKQAYEGYKAVMARMGTIKNCAFYWNTVPAWRKNNLIKVPPSDAISMDG